MSHTLLITGGSGFIGSAVARLAVARGFAVVNVDKLTYSGTLGSTRSIADSDLYHHEKVDIVDEGAMLEIMKAHQPDGIIHLAAESHVDRSIDTPDDFVTTNILGTVSLLSAATAYCESLTDSKRNAFRFHHVSTDEVFGALGDEGVFTSSTPYDPRSPYSASKASADHFVRAWHHTYGLPTLMSNCSNNYGPFQFPEKLIPLMTIRAMSGQSLPVYGAGGNIRDWLYVSDHAHALLRIYEAGEIGETYLVGGREERTNLDVVRLICQILDAKLPADDGRPRSDRIEFTADRPGHDFRYSIDVSETSAELGWEPRTAFVEGLERTVDWYVANRWWWAPLVDEGHGVSRQGLESGV